MLALMETWCPVGTLRNDPGDSLTENSFVSWVTVLMDCSRHSWYLGSVGEGSEKSNMNTEQMTFIVMAVHTMFQCWFVR